MTPPPHHPIIADNFRASVKTHRDRVARGEVRLILMRFTTPVAALVSIGDLERWEERDRREGVRK